MSIPRKLKICKTCGDPSYIFAHGNCRNCDGMLRANKHYAALQAEKKPFKPLSQINDIKVAKAFKIAPISKNRAEALKKYRIERDKYFNEHPICEFPGCASLKITLHHRRGRCGTLLTDSRYFCSLCLKHHNYVNEHNEEAQKLGLVASRLATTY